MIIFSNPLVTDEWGHCIHYIDKKGSLIMVFMVKDYGLQAPWGIGVDHQSGRIWCGTASSKEIVLFKYWG